MAEIQTRILSLQQPPPVAAPPVPAKEPQPVTAFAEQLRKAVEQPRTTARLDGRGIPVDLAGFGNGRIPADALSRVGDTRHLLWDPAARSLTALIEAARADGVTIGVNSGYRSYDEQAHLVRTKGLYSRGGLAARPGTSEHGWGMAADLHLNRQALSWMRQNAGAYDFVENVPRESWHWAYKPSL
ncbi:M15 family metallopeptidase [Actinoplanes sp. NBRC 101535]|uniref:M15 family metallopeptidase n=1 Tax=Actinoplanes sp. NBRC 101535 TaxID=3032196 RepID=UPI002555308D|nr:M15 family metallopeptidase [Actinoplanes sp. NBRC 101535]